jgi:Family of unknown function (DUF5372)
VHSLPTSWTDAGAIDPFVAIAAGRSLFRIVDLIELAQLIGEWKLGVGRRLRSCKGKDAVNVNQMLSEHQVIVPSRSTVPVRLSN